MKASVRDQSPSTAAGPDLTEHPFRRFGPYVLVRCTGAGGFGRVDVALKGSPDLVKLCAVKRMRKDEFGADLEARFRREAQIALRLSHGAIAHTLGVEQIEGELCLLQEFVEGVNLSQLQSQSRPELLPVLVAVYVAREVARALAYAHGCGIVHRDVTPDNIMLSFDGQVKLVDFGIARGTGDATLTRTGVVVGREIYTAPEVWAGGKAGAQADIYSLGVVLWQLATGQNFQDIQNARGVEVTDPRELNPDLSPELASIILRAIAPEPKDRFQTAGELAEALGTVLPSGFGGESHLAAVLSRHFNVERERKMLADDIEAAKPLLGGPNSGPVPISPSPSRPGGLGYKAVMVGVAASLFGFTAITTAEHYSGRREAARVARPIGAGIQSPSEALAKDEPVHGEGIGTPVAGMPTTSNTNELPPLARLPIPEDQAVPSGNDGRPSNSPDADPSPGSRAGQALARGRSTTLRAEIRQPARLPTPPTTQSGAEMLKEARERWDNDDVDGALVLARNAAAAHGGGAEAHVLIGTLLLKKGQRPEAEKEFKEALRLDPSNGKASRLLRLTRGARADGDWRSVEVANVPR
jgi:serine/threonine protein kinase